LSDFCLCIKNKFISIFLISISFALFAVDKLENEPEDFRYGKFVYDSLNDLYIDSNIGDARVRELFFAEVYKLNDTEFTPFIENAVNDKLTPQQKQWATNTMRDIERDLKKDDTGLRDLD
jgi:hypothetical protein